MPEQVGPEHVAPLAFAREEEDARIKAQEAISNATTSEEVNAVLRGVPTQGK